MSQVLTPGTPSERERIEAAGGWVTEETELVLARLHHMKLEDPLAQEKLKSQNYLSIITHRVCSTCLQRVYSHTYLELCLMA